MSIVTVFNDPDVRRDCLDRSVERGRLDAPQTEFLPIDNTGRAFASAGAALNHGAALARHDYLAFVHQDVYLHSLTALEEAAGRVADDQRIGLLGAIGVTAEGRFLGKVRDRIFLLGDAARAPADVDCVDELLFMIPRRVLDREPLPEDRELAWHAYAVEYGLRVRAHGLRVCAMDIPLTHNSLTVNLDQLDVAYAAIAARHPTAMPVVTPQGTVAAGGRARDKGGRLRAQRWRARWLLESVSAQKGSRAAGGARCVLADIRLDVDELLSALPEDPGLLVANADQQEAFIEDRGGPLSLTRLGRRILLSSSPVATLGETLRAHQGPILVTNLHLEDVRTVSAQVADRRRVVGFWTSLGYWMLIDVPPSAMPAAWHSRRARPLGTAAV